MEKLSKYHKAIELDKVLEMLAKEATMPDAADLARRLVPSSNIELVNRLLGQTQDAYTLIAKYGAPSFGSVRNMSATLNRANAGGVLSMRELLDIGELLRVIRSLKEWRSENSAENGCSLDEFFDFLSPNKYFEEKIFMSIRSEDELYENASSELYDICRKIRSASQGIRDRLDKMIRSSQYAKVLQDSIVTMRDGRFVVPVKAEHRGSVPGLVHDTSASGATLFIEPAAVVEINNDLKILESRKKEEIDRILAELSSEAGDFSRAILDSYDAAVQLNLIFAKAKLAFNMRASMPQINNAGKIRLKNARHPLIAKEKVVPISVELGYDYDTLVITGPNTGGKTVSLKMIGLFPLMAACGLMLPVDDGSCVSVFDQVLVDIGDEQSIEQSLSTFSSHMKNIISILNIAQKGSLVLIDELGAGTDPIEGAALATSILMKLREQGATVVSTTHYAELKSYALDTDGVENGSCEFDVSTLRPTYKLLIGVPGRSNAFAISKRLGLENSIVDTAKSLISDENLRFEKVVSSLETARQQAEDERAQAQAIRVELAKVRQSNSKAIEELNRERDRILEKARSEARSLVDKTRAESNRLLNELEELRKSSAKDKGELARRARAAAKTGMNKLENAADPVENRRDMPYELPRELKVGDRVMISDIGNEGVVIKISGDKKQVEVQAGIFKSRVDIKRLRLLEDNNKVTVGGRKISGITSKAERKVGSEVDLRGMATDEALLELDRYIDHAVMSGIPSVSIIHGKGTGVLRTAVQQHLRRHKNIKSFRLGVFGEGETGVTIAEIK